MRTLFKFLYGLLLKSLLFLLFNPKLLILITSHILLVINKKYKLLPLYNNWIILARSLPNLTITSKIGYNKTIHISMDVSLHKLQNH